MITTVSSSYDHYMRKYQVPRRAAATWQALSLQLLVTWRSSERPNAGTGKWEFQWPPQGKYCRWSSVVDKICMMLAWTNRPRHWRTHTVLTASIGKVFYSTQTQRDKRISWQLLLSYVCLWANLFIFRSTMQIIPHFTPTLIMWFWTVPVNKRVDSLSPYC